MEFDTCYQYVTSDQDTDAKIKLMKYLYVDAIGEVPPNTPETRGKPIQINFYLRYNHAGDKVTIRYHNYILIY